MKYGLLALTLVLCAAVPAVGVAAPAFPGEPIPMNKAPTPDPSKPPTGTKKAKKKGKAPAPTGGSTATDSKAGTYTGVVKSMTIGKAGDIIDMSIKIAGSVATVRVEGCGSKSADQPLLNWAFQQKRLVYVTADGGGCFSNVIVPG